nr:uncharacterized protein LOC106615567 [Bactrocera oleae]
MFKKVFKDNKNALTLLLLLGLFGITMIEALQCYDCYDCDDDEDLNELQICGEFATTPASGNGDNSENMVVVTRNTTLGPGNTTNTATTSNTTKEPTFNEGDSEDNSEDEDDENDVDEYDDEWRFQPSRHMSSRTGDDVCYVVKLKVNDTIITKRGCATFLDDDDTCKSVSAGLNLQTCHLCEADGCNKFTGYSDDWGALWNGVEKVNAELWFILPLLILLIFLKY